MDWTQIAEDWAAMTRRLGNSGLHAPDIFEGPQVLGGDGVPRVDDGAPVSAAQAVVTVARRLADK